MKKILICVPDLKYSCGGPTTSIINQINLLKNTNYEVNILSLTIDKELTAGKSNKFFIINQNLNKPNIYKRIYRIFKIIKEHDTIHIHSFWSKFVFFLIIISKLQRKQIIITPHGMLRRRDCQNEKIKIFLLKFIKYIFLEIDYFHFLTEEEKIDTFNFLNKKSKYIIQSNWVRKINNKKFLHKSIYKRGFFNIVFLGRIHPVKRIDFQIKLISLLNKNNIKCNLNIIGPVSDHKYFEHLKELAQRYEISNYIKFLGPIYNEEKFAYIKHSDCCLLTSKHESSSMSALEIMQSSGILIASKECSLSKVAESGAIIEASFDLNIFYEIIKSLLIKKSIDCETIKEKAKKYIKRYHSEQNALKNFEFIYNN